MKTDEPKVQSLRLSPWQMLTLFALCLGYAGYYLCRSDLSVIAPLLLDDKSLNLSKENLGWITSISVYAYAIGKVISGLAVDSLGGRKLLLWGMGGSIACTLFFSAGAGVLFFLAVWAVNRFLQSTGWNALVKVSTHWFSHQQYGRIVGILSLSFLFGDFIGRLYLGQLISWGWGWRAVLLAAAATLGFIWIFCYLTIRDEPTIEQLGGNLPEENPNNLFAEDSEGNKSSIGQLLRPLLTSEAFWCVAVMCFGYTLVRETFNFWLPQYFKEVAGLSDGEAGKWSSLFPLFGGFSVLICGWLSDHPLKGRRGAIMVASSLGLTVCLLAMGRLPTHSTETVPIILSCAVALLMIGPYCFLGGAIAMDLGGKKGSATAAGLVDAAGYLGGALSGFFVGKLVQKWGWSGAYGFMAGVSVLTCVAAMLYVVRHENVRREPIFVPLKSEEPE